jgi:hypothetical protein
MPSCIGQHWSALGVRLPTTASLRRRAVALSSLCAACAACATLGQPPARPPLPGVLDDAPPEWIQVPGLDSLFKRELGAGLTAQSIASADGRYQLQVEATAAPKNEPPAGNLFTFSVPLGDDVAECTVQPLRILPAHRVRRIAAALKEKLDIKALALVQVSAVDGNPLAIYDLVYTTQAAGGAPQVGEYKVALLTSTNLSMICTEDRPGYREVFARAVKQLAHSLTDTQAKALPPITFRDLHVARLQGKLVGWSAGWAWAAGSDGLHREDAASTMLFPTAKPGEPIARDLARLEWLDKSGLLSDGGYELWRNEVLTDVGLKHEGQAWVLDGTEGEKPLKGPIATKGELRGGPAAELLAVLSGAKAEQLVRTYSPLRPLEATEVVYARDPSRPRGIVVRVAGAGELVLSGTLDANGALESFEMPAGPLQITAKRLWTTGTPP